MRFVNKIEQFLKEVRMEIKRVNWLTRSDVLRFTIMVVVFSLAVAAYLGTIDFVVQWVIKEFIYIDITP